MATSTIPPGFVQRADGMLVPVAPQPGVHALGIHARKLLIVLMYYAGDMERIIELAKLINDLERVGNQEADILFFGRWDAPAMPNDLMEQLRMKFASVTNEKSRRYDAVGFPYGANEMWYDLVGQMGTKAMQAKYTAFLNLEYDCVPTRPGWIREILTAWKRASAEGFLVMGHQQVQMVPGAPATHFNGVAVYDTNLLHRIGSKLTGCHFQMAYDVANSELLNPVGMDTPLMFVEYRLPTIQMEDLFAPRKNGVAPAIFHGVRDRSALLAVRSKHIERGVAQDLSKETVFTYYENVPQWDSKEIDAQMALWRTGWQTRGWNPIVLTKFDAMKHPRYAEFLARVDSLPTVNVRAYERACWIRWLAFAVSGGGLMTDYDVLPAKFRPADAPPRQGFQILGRTVPCIVQATRDGANQWVDAIMAAEALPTDVLADASNRPHLSDMTLVQRMLKTTRAEDGKPAFPWIIQEDFNREVGEAGWQESPTVHFAAYPMQKYAPGKMKSAAMMEFLRGG